MSFLMYINYILYSFRHDLGFHICSLQVEGLLSQSSAEPVHQAVVNAVASRRPRLNGAAEIAPEPTMQSSAPRPTPSQSSTAAWAPSSARSSAPDLATPPWRRHPTRPAHPHASREANSGGWKNADGPFILRPGERRQKVNAAGEFTSASSSQNSRQKRKARRAQDREWQDWWDQDDDADIQWTDDPAA